MQNEWKAAKEAAKENNNIELLYHVPCMENDSAEMWDRFSMQDNAPDIMITNYSMLNIMLMRNLEADIFSDTKKWLEESPSHIFHLVIDELHTYRGTAGTEVAYLLRILLDRLGLQPSSPQVQFLASSASLEENQQSIDFLSEFFGIEKDEFRKKFKIISNPPQQSVEKPNIILPIDELKKYGSVYEEDANADNTLLKILGCDNFYELSIKYQLLSWLKYALSSNKGIIAKDIQKIADRLGLFGEERLSVVAGLIKALCKSEKNGQYLAPLRAHFFFRNISGLWGCSDPNCPCIRNEYKFSGRTIGTLYKRPRNVCTCGMKVLEVLVCENCGEIYLGGYRVAVNNHTYLSSEKPVNDKECGYCILWHGNADSKDGWKRVSLILVLANIILI